VDIRTLTRTTTISDTSALDDQSPLYNSGILGNYIHYLQSRQPDVDIDALLRCCEITRFDLNDEGHFFSQQQINAFHQCLDERVSDPDLAYKVGLHALYMKSTGTVMQYGLQFITPHTMYKAVDRIYPKWSRGHVCQTTITGKSQAEVTVSVRPGVREQPFQCKNRQGILESIAKIQTGQAAQVDHPQCMHRGDEACRYLVAWKAKPSAIWKRAGAFAGLFSLLLTAATPFFLPVVPWALLVLTMALICLTILLVASRLEKKELVSFLKDQGDTAGHLLQEIEIRHYNARLVQEIGKASTDILEMDTFLATVLKSITRYTSFTRGMIALCEDGRSRLCQVASLGFSDPEQQVIEKMEVCIDIDNTADIFMQSLKDGRPLFLGDIQDQAPHLPPNSARMLKDLQVETLISIPLIYKKEPIGFLFVDAKGAKKDAATSDVNLLMGIASQIATGIVNARSYSQMQESEQRYRLLTENVADVIWILDCETLKLRYISPSVEKAQGYTPDELMALAIDQYLTPDSARRVAMALTQALEAAKTEKIDPKSYSTTLELEEYHKNGSIIPIEVTAGFLLDKNGQPDAVLGISRNLSERKRADRERTEVENKLQQSKKMESLGTMAGSIAHNFNNLLMVVLGNLELAQEDLPEPSTTVTNIQRAINAAQRAADLSGMMLTYVGQLKKESVPVDLSQVVESVLRNIDEPTMTHVDLDLDLADPMPLIAADADQMRQMTSGFVTNAIEALENKGGRIRISTGSMHCDRHFLSTTYLKEEMPEGMYAYVKVADTGCGMDAETLGNVFDPFFSTKFTGRGLGMAAVMGIIRSHGGAIKVSSVKNEGSVFTALFPIQGVSLGQAKPDPVQAGSDATGKTVLLVDDEAMVMEVGIQFLERLGYKVLEASSGQQALDIFARASNAIDCVLLDYTMPGMDGLQTMQQLREIRTDACIIITSGYTRQQLEDRFADIGLPNDFIQKPFQMKALQEKLDRVIPEPV
jgi:PAS domain S-box-containing protein